MFRFTHMTSYGKQGDVRCKYMANVKEYVPLILGPVKFPPIIGITTRFCPSGTGPRSNEGPSAASMLYKNVIAGGTGVEAPCAIVAAAKAVSAVIGFRRCMIGCRINAWVWLTKKKKKLFMEFDKAVQGTLSFIRVFHFTLGISHFCCVFWQLRFPLPLLWVVYPGTVDWDSPHFGCF